MSSNILRWDKGRSSLEGATIEDYFVNCERNYCCRLEGDRTNHCSRISIFGDFE